jgi:hypothetical protein
VISRDPAGVAQARPPSRPTNGADSALPFLIAACVTATVAFWAFSATLLPGVDLGDTGGYQAAALWPETSARQGYPLYYAMARPFLRAVSPSNPARGLNLLSAVWAAIGTGLLTYLAGRVTRSAVAGAASGALLAFSHTFWTQAIIAEVYTLHLTLIAVSLLALGAFHERPGLARLSLFFIVYAVAFGNHLAMVLLLIPFALFIVAVDRDRLRLLRPSTVALAVAIAAAATLLYSGNFLAVMTSVESTDDWNGRVATFWFDVTKADWRETMVLGVERGSLRDRIAMWAWDAQQQFGVAGIAAAAIGLAGFALRARPWALVIAASYLASVLFAITYNVGDVHVFFLPAHFFTAFAVAGVVLLVPDAGPRNLGRWLRLALPIMLLGYAAWRGYATWPLVDRHDDVRADTLVAQVAYGVSDDDAILLSQMDWQSENALLYAGRHQRRDLAWTRLADVLNYLPFLVDDNHAIGRDVVLTSRAAASIVAAYGPFFPIVPDDPFPLASLEETAARLPPGTPYVLTILPPASGETIDGRALDATRRALTGSATGGALAPFAVFAGVVGEPPAFQRMSRRPFRADVSLLGDRFTVAFESWMPFDTFRRAGFGRVLRDREPVLTIERGASLVWFRQDGSSATVYGAGLYAPQHRFRIPRRAEQFARLRHSNLLSSSHAAAHARLVESGGAGVASGTGPSER